LTLANQYIGQLDEATANALFCNVGTLISFQVSASDTERLALQLGYDLGPPDLMRFAPLPGLCSLGRQRHTKPPVFDADNAPGNDRRGRSVGNHPSHPGSGMLALLRRWSMQLLRPWPPDMRMAPANRTGNTDPGDPPQSSGQAVGLPSMRFPQVRQLFPDIVAADILALSEVWCLRCLKMITTSLSYG
jgi:hypothetical protein